MPNWCDNRLVIKGDTKELTRFKEAVKGMGAVYALSDAEKSLFKDDAKPRSLALSFHALVPVPSNVLQKPYGEGGYDWQIANWGTKWEASQPYMLDEFENELWYEFSTAWSPPETWVKQVSLLFPALSFDLAYYEGGNAVAGYTVYEDGEITESEQAFGDVAAAQTIAVEKVGYAVEDFEEEEEEA